MRDFATSGPRYSARTGIYGGAMIKARLLASRWLTRFSRHWA
jgi:hypothetical protein